ncbi:PqqD family peptide modification chaperone [Rhodococcus pyridinivorans]|uniref:PqqD family peptide modification chaperone n=1 Tax=Rhodococcus pyridinivorans TaxID=103816 RepID=UPI00265ABA1E|nr:PqqD family peptide modification chaperone [Rhodococcus pyridinivorans]
MMDPEISFSIAEGGAVLLDRRDGRYFRLNGSAANIVEALSSSVNGKDVSEQAVVHAVEALYDIDPEMLRQDVDSVVSFLVDHGLGQRK